MENTTRGTLAPARHKIQFEEGKKIEQLSQ
jgi:hypothetical protein